MNDESTQRRASRPPGRRRLRSGTTLLASVATLGASALGFLAFAPATAFAATAPSNASNLGYTPITPARVCDTRSTTAAGGSDVTSGVTGQCANSGTALASGNELDVAIPTSVVPSGAQAVVLNVTAIGATAPGFLSVYAATGAAPSSLISNVNFAAGQDVANSVTVADNAGAVDVYFGPASPSASVNVAVDVQGYYMTPSSTTGDPYTAITPTRVADTRCGTSPAPSYCAGENLPSANSSLTTVGANSSINVAVAGVGSVPSTATAVSLNVTATDGSAASYLKVYPTGSTPAVTSNQNWQAGETLASQVVSKVGTNGDVSLYNFAGTVDYVVDVTGYYTAAGTSGSLFTSLGTPMRLADTRCAVSPTPSYCSAENLPSANSSLAAPSGGQSITVATGAPSGATSAALDVTDVMPATGNFLTAYPTGGTLNTVSTVNWVPGDTYNVVPNAAYATLSSSGDTSIYNGPSYAGAANVVVDMFGYFAPPVTNAVYAVSGPSPSATPTVSTSTTTTGDVTYTVSGLPTASGDTAQVALFPSTGSDAPVNTNGTWTFTSTGGSGVAGNAAGEGTTNTSEAYIASVNGVPTTGSPDAVYGTSTDSGSLSFVLNSTSVDGAVPVIYTAPSSAGSTPALAVGTNGEPATGYAIGVGSATTWVAAAAPAVAGTTPYTDYVVTAVNPSSSTFEACEDAGVAANHGVLADANGQPSSACYTFTYGQTGSSYYYTDGTPITESDFASYLSPAMPTATEPNTTTAAPVLGDELTIGTTTGYSTTTPSSFEFVVPNGDVPTAPTSVAATFSTTGGPGSTPAVTITWTPPVNLDVSGSQATPGGTTTPTHNAMYTVYQSADTNGTLSAPVKLGTVFVVPAGSSDITNVAGGETSVSSPEFIDTTGTAGTSYVYYVTATSSNVSGTQTTSPGPFSTASSPVVFGAAPSTPAMVSVAITPSSCTANCTANSTTAPTGTPGMATITYNEAVTCPAPAATDFSYTNSLSSTDTYGIKGSSCSGTGSTTVTVTFPLYSSTLSGGTEYYTYEDVAAPNTGDSFSYTAPSTNTPSFSVYAGTSTNPVYAATQSLTDTGNPTPLTSTGTPPSNPVTATAPSMVSAVVTAESSGTAGSIAVTYNEAVTCPTAAFSDFTYDSATSTSGGTITGCSASGDTVTLTTSSAAATTAPTSTATLVYTAPTTNSTTASVYAGSTSAPVYASAQTLSYGTSSGPLT